MDYMVFDFEKESILFQNPIETIMANHVDDIIPALRRIENWTKKGYYAAGYLAYEAAPAFDSSFEVNNETSELPLLWFGIFDQPHTACMAESSEFQVSNWLPYTSQEHYDSCIQEIRDAISRGDTYQVNYTIRLQATFSGDDFGFYRKITKNQQANYSAYLHMGRYRILSASPELFFAKKDRHIITKPMKGTVSRGRYTKEDEQKSAWLYESEKNRAENLMIVDLLRNDLGKICTMGSIDVTHLFDIERYPTVFQMTSTIEGKLRPEIEMVDIFSALFPCGSITGAPKIQTMREINRLEDTPRGVYCGSIGYIQPNGDAIFNVAIRTVVIDSLKEEAEFGVGGGITWDSTAQGEYQEVIDKAKLLTQDSIDFELLETLLLENGEYFLLSRHMEKLTQTAKYFRIDLDPSAVLSELEKYKELDLEEVQRVRLLVSKSGRVKIEGTPFQPDSATSSMVQLANQPICSSNLFLYHKTTYRDFYNALRIQDEEVFDTLLWNERGEVTEFTFGNIVVELQGVKYTPPVTSGLLPGTFRKELIERGIIFEKVILLAELREAEQIWFINSVRKWIPVKLRDSQDM
ncbi:MAG TPA: aminodeoxychorismate synthase component I [Bacillota bacterium]|nr:aminodeoxychorismate synthase component I [Bacillota bacterium]